MNEVFELFELKHFIEAELLNTAYQADFDSCLAWLSTGQPAQPERRAQAIKMPDAPQVKQARSIEEGEGITSVSIKSYNSSDKKLEETINLWAEMRFKPRPWGLIREDKPNVEIEQGDLIHTKFIVEVNENKAFTFDHFFSWDLNLDDGDRIQLFATLEDRSYQSDFDNFVAFVAGGSSDPAPPPATAVQQAKAGSKTTEKRQAYKSNQWLIAEFFEKGQTDLKGLVDEWLQIRETQDYQSPPHNPLRSMQTVISEERERRQE